MMTTTPCVAVKPRLDHVLPQVTAKSSRSVGATSCNWWRWAEAANIFSGATSMEHGPARHWMMGLTLGEACPSSYKKTPSWTTLSILSCLRKPLTAYEAVALHFPDTLFVTRLIRIGTGLWNTDRGSRRFARWKVAWRNGELLTAGRLHKNGSINSCNWSFSRRFCFKSDRRVDLAGLILC